MVLYTGLLEDVIFTSNRVALGVTILLAERSDEIRPYSLSQLDLNICCGYNGLVLVGEVLFEPQLPLNSDEEGCYTFALVTVARFGTTLLPPNTTE